MHSKKLIYLLSFILPLGVLLGVCVALEVQPFGDSSLLIIDGLHQYMPFFSVLQDKLQEGSSLFYSFRAGLGINFLSLFSYYLSSPLNLLVLFVKKTYLNGAVSMLIVIKIALSGLNAGIYFTHRAEKAGKKADLSVLFPVLAYVLNSYMVGYCWNAMWLDSIMIFPIIMLGLERLIDEKDGRLYCIALFYALYCNYYIGFMICIFMVLWYILYEYRSVGQFFSRIFSFAFWSLLSGGLAAFLLVPAYFGIRQTAAGKTMVLPVHSWITGFADLVTRQFALASPIAHDNFDGNANLYTGIFTVFLLFIYLLNRKTGLWEKIKRIALIVLFYCSFAEMILNYVWHGFHDQYGIPNRFSFLYSFLLIYLAYETWIRREGTRLWHCIVSAVIGIALLLVSRFLAETPLDDYVYAICALLFVLYALLLGVWCRKPSWRKVYGTLFCLAAIVEMCVTCVIGFNTNGQISISKFFSGTEDMEEASADQDNGTFFRSELADSKMVDENAWYRLNGVGLFGSTAMNTTVNIMDSLGFYTGANEYLYEGATPLTNLLFNVRYVYYHSDDVLATNFEYKDTYGDFDVYENPIQDGSIGYLISNDIDNWYYQSDYPFRVLNDFCYQGYGYDNIFIDVPVSDPVTDGCTAERTNDGEYYFTYEKQMQDNMTFTFHVEEGADQFFIHYDGTQVSNAEIAVNGSIVRSGDIDGYIIPIGKVPSDSTITVRFQLLGEMTSGYVRMSAARLDESLFDELTAQMISKKLQVTKSTDTYIEGNVRAAENETLLLSIPSDPGWTVYVDGKKTDTATAGNAFLTVPLETGEHHIVLRYIPVGFEIGWKISLFALILFLLGWHMTSRETVVPEEPGDGKDSDESERPGDSDSSGESKGSGDGEDSDEAEISNRMSVIADKSGCEIEIVPSEMVEVVDEGTVQTLEQSMSEMPEVSEHVFSGESEYLEFELTEEDGISETTDPADIGIPIEEQQYKIEKH